MARILVCKPTYYAIEYEINPWMHIQNPADTQLAIRQWHGLVDILREVGAEVVEMDGQPHLPDMVFTANAGLVLSKKRVVLSNFKCPERQPEQAFFRKWFEDNGFDVKTDFIASPYTFEGAGDALFLKQTCDPEYNTLFLGYGFRSDYEFATLGLWGGVWSNVTKYLKLVDPYFYHLDTCFCPLKDDYALIWPGAFTPDDVYSLSRTLELLKVPEEDAKKFACNAVAVDNKVIIPSGCEATRKLLNSAGFEVFDTDMSEYIKAGGACKCLTLRLE